MEVIYEFTQIGSSVKVCAIDTNSGIEAVVIVPSNITKKEMQSSALAKLKYLIEKKKTESGYF